MKKRLLITSIVMMLVVAVAISTATYAWFTSSNSVTATSLSMTAATNNAAALEISYVNTEGTWQTTIAATNPDGSFNPAAPSVMALPVTTPSATPGTLYSAITWANSDVINGKFKADGTGNQQYVWNDGEGEGKGHTSFYLHNGSTANVITGITMSATIEGAAAPFIRIAVFKKDGSGNFELLGVISNLENYTKATSYAANTDYYYYDTSTTSYVKDTAVTDSSTFATQAADHMLYVLDDEYDNLTAGAITADKLVSAMTDEEICTETVALGGLAVNNNAQAGADEMELKVAIWMDGIALNDDTAGSTGKTASIGLTFEASRA